MKHFYFTILMLLAGLGTQAQVGIGPKLTESVGQKSFDEAQLAKLKASTTYFLCHDQAEADAFQPVFEKVWTFTKGIQCIPYTEFDKKTGANTSFFSINGWTLHTKKEFKKEKPLAISIYLLLAMVENDKKGRPKLKSFARIELYGDYPTMKNALDNYGSSDRELYENGVFRNWRVGFFKNYLQVINAHLQAGEVLIMSASASDPELIDLSKTTLYIPEHLLIRYNARNGDESDRFTGAYLMKDYPYKWKVVPDEEMQNMITSATGPIYYLQYVRSSSTKYLQIYNGHTGKILYSIFKGISYNIKQDDLAVIAKAIKTQKKKAGK